MAGRLSIVRRGLCVRSFGGSGSPWLLRLVPLGGLLVGLEACGDPPVDPPVPTTVTVTPQAATLDAVGDTVGFTATVKDQDGQTMSGVSVTWSSSVPGVATVGGTGLATARSATGARPSRRLPAPLRRARR